MHQDVNHLHHQQPFDDSILLWLPAVLGYLGHHGCGRSFFGTFRQIGQKARSLDLSTKNWAEKHKQKN